MRVLIAFDKFKGALSAEVACEIAAEVLAKHQPEWTVDICPLSDGGEGFSDILTHAAGGSVVEFPVHGPSGQPITASAGLVRASNLPTKVRQRISVSDDGLIGIAEMAKASGLTLLPPAERNPWQVGTYGTGELLAGLASSHVGAILLGIGGSGTNDLGTGALAALGLQFLTQGGERLSPPIPSTWDRVEKLHGGLPEQFPPIFVACDVKNPLLGPTGATAVYGPQKGLSPADVPRLESSASRIAGLLTTHFGKSMSLAHSEGVGAAGGIAFGLTVAANAKLVPGFDLFSEWMDLPRRLELADIVITGEGRFDETSLTGKGPGTLVAEASGRGKEVHVFAGSCGRLDPRVFHPITPSAMDLETAMRNSRELLRHSLESQFIRYPRSETRPSNSYTQQ